MYTTVQSARRWNNVAPWIVVLLFSLILFAIAATIVISLIALYLPTRNITPVSSVSGPLSVNIPLPQGTNLTTGALDSGKTATVQDKMSTTLASDSSTQGKAGVRVSDATALPANAKRKRQTTITIAVSVNVTFNLNFTNKCSTSECHAQVKANAKRIFAKIQLFFGNLTSGTNFSTSTPAGGSGGSGGSGNGGASGNSSGNGTSGSDTTSPSSSLLSSSSSSSSSSNESLVSDIPTISEFWGNLRPYADNQPDYFGVTNTGLPVGCQIEQAFVLHRHAARFPTGADANDFTALSKRIYNASGEFTGPLTFLNTWTYLLGTEVLLPEGTYMETKSGLDFWDRYGRLLYNAAPGQRFYNITGTTNTKPLLRCNSIGRVNDSAHAWANGFFALYNPELQYTLLVMNATPGYNVTLASFISCKNFANSSNGIFDTNEGAYIPVDNYLGPAVTRLSQYMPPNFSFSTRDAYVFQSLCTYEYNLAAQSDFCSLFTLTEWKGFSYTLDLYVYNGYSFGHPMGRALGLGVLQELLARLQNQTITIGNSSVDTNLDGNTNTFPMGQQFYLDLSHDFMITGLLTAMSLDYFRNPLSYSAYPPDESRTWKTTHIIPYAARLITEKIGCASANPPEVNTQPTQYSPTQYGWSPTNAPNKFIRMKLNYGVLPISTIRGGFCAGRTDGLCPLSNFIASQANATAQANYGNICFGSYTYDANQFGGDGNYFPGNGGASGSATTTPAPSSSNESLVSDIPTISEFWGNLRPYADNQPDYFGVNNTGLPVGCQIEQAFVLHRHAARFPTGADANDFTALSKRIYNATGNFTGPLTFLNTWTYLLGTEVLLPEGTYMETKSGLDFWDRYGRLLYNAAPGQRFYNITGTTNTKPLLRCNSIGRVNDSAHAWANGFFALYNPELQYTLLVMNATPGYNVTLASFISCKNFANSSNGIFDTNEGAYIPVDNYLGPAVTRLSQYMPPNFSFSTRDAYVFQSLCTYEYNLAAQSDFCNLFTLTEWKGFSYTLDLYVYNGYSFGHPMGRALGLGVLQELLARLQNQTITIGNSSVDTNLDGNTNTFPMGQQFYLDLSHDFMITGLLTAMSLDYFRNPLSYSAYPPDESRTWKTTHIIPYAARLITEKIGCASANPPEVKTQPTQYSPTQYGWSPTNAPNKFIRMKLNYGVLPISTIRGGLCAGRTDGLCPLNNFIASQANATAEANYGNICFGSYTYDANQFGGDGNYFPGNGGASGSATTTPAPSSSNESLVSDIPTISEFWGNLRPYADNQPDYFGVNNTGLPVGCQIEQAFVLHRHAARFPTGADANDFTALSKRIYNASGGFTGPLTFLNTWTYLLGSEVLLPEGTYMETKSGLDFWDRYGRLLYNAAPGQRFYNITGTTNTKPLLRCNSIGRVNDSAHAWANGFFALYNPELQYTLLVMNATPGYNVTLASFISCKNFANSSNGIFDTNEGAYIPVDNYLGPAVTRLKQYMPPNFSFSTRDAYVFQSLCTYEYNLAAQSDFCNLFTLTEWKGFSYTLDLYVYNGYSFGHPMGRALGLGVLQELLARLQNQTITIGNSSVDTNLDGNTNTFPMGQQFYLDLSHDFMITGLLTAMSLDYFRNPLSYSAYPPDESRTWKTTHIIPYAARLITEKIGCASANPPEVKTQPTQYSPTQYGWSPTNAPNKFIRMKLNYGVLPISTIRGGLCAARTDGLCPLNNFIASQANATAEANYGNICFGSYTYDANQFGGDGNYFF